MAFPAEKLIATGGELYCHVFENSLTEIPRDLYWSATLEFAPIDYCGDSLTCSATIEWLRIAQRDFRQISDFRFSLDGTDSFAEASFYMSRHDNATSASMSLTFLDADRFRLGLDMVVDFLGYDDGDADPALYVAGVADVSYSGLIIVPGNLFPKPGTVDDVLAVAGDFVNLDSYGPPHFQGFRYVLKPVGGSP